MLISLSAALSSSKPSRAVERGGEKKGGRVKKMGSTQKKYQESQNFKIKSLNVNLEFDYLKVKI